MPSEQLRISSPFLRAKINREEENLSRNLVCATSLSFSRISESISLPNPNY